jgi:hypothetical protein
MSELPKGKRAMIYSNGSTHMPRPTHATLLILQLLFYHLHSATTSPPSVHVPPAPFILFLFNNSHRSGGPAALHHACYEAGKSTVVRAGFLGRNPVYAQQYDKETCQAVEANQTNLLLDSRDIIVVPEKWQGNIGIEPDLVRKARALGARGVTYVLSISGSLKAHTLRDLTHEGWIPIAHSHFTQSYFGIPWSPLISPLEPFVHEAAKIWEKNEESVIMQKKGRKNVVAIDADARIVIKVPPVVDGIQLHVIELRNFTPIQVIDVYQSASIIVDMYLNGLERATLEGILFGCYPIIIASDNGLNRNDFNLPDFARVDPHNDRALLDSITFILKNYDSPEMKIAYQPFKNFVVNLQISSAHASNQIFKQSRRWQFQIMLVDGEMMRNQFSGAAALLGALSIFQRYPLASVEIVVFSQAHSTDENRDAGLERYLRKHGRLLSILSDLGLTTHQGGGDQYSLRVRGSRSRDPNAPSVVHGDFLVLSEEPLMSTNDNKVEILSSAKGLRVAAFLRSNKDDQEWFLRFNNDNGANSVVAQQQHGEGGQRSIIELPTNIGTVKEYGKDLQNQLSNTIPNSFFKDIL